MEVLHPRSRSISTKQPTSNERRRAAIKAVARFWKKLLELKNNKRGRKGNKMTKQDFLRGSIFTVALIVLSAEVAEFTVEVIVAKTMAFLAILVVALAAGGKEAPTPKRRLR